MTRKHLPLVVTLSFLGVLALNGASRQSKAARLDGESRGSLHLSFHPYTGAGHEGMPVEVLKFDVVVHSTSMWVREWQVKNRSGKPTTKIRPALFVYSESEPETLLLRHPILPYYGVRLDRSEEWPQGPCSSTAKLCRNSFAMLPANELLQPLAKSGEPEGKYRIALGIDKVWFKDGTVWEFGAAKDK